MSKPIIDNNKMVPGKKYKGYAFLNEAMEFCFTPEETGSREGVIKILTTNENATVSYSNKFIFARIKLKRKSDKAALMSELTKQYNFLFKTIMEYDF